MMPDRAHFRWPSAILPTLPLEHAELCLWPEATYGARFVDADGSARAVIGTATERMAVGFYVSSAGRWQSLFDASKPISAELLAVIFALPEHPRVERFVSGEGYRRL